MSEINYAFPKIHHIDPSCYIDAYNLILECSQAHSPRSFAIRLLDLLNKMCPYDRVFVFFLDTNQKISGRYVINIPDEWVNEYLNYYLENEQCPVQYSITRSKVTLDNSLMNVISWKDMPSSIFTKEYIKAQQLTYSMGFGFHDMNGLIRVIIALDRTRDIPFNDVELKRMQLARPILNNMYCNFYYQGTDSNSDTASSVWSEYHFTKRETEIVNLLCQGMSIQKVSEALFIAKTTAYKHIAHIYEKVGVSSQKELLFRLMDL